MDGSNRRLQALLNEQNDQSLESTLIEKCLPR
jgi:hypothetical protein